MIDPRLQNRDYTIILARSDRQNLNTPPGLESQWLLAEKSIINLAKQCEQFDPDGITIYIAASPLVKYEHTTSADLVKVFQENYAIQHLNLVETLAAALNDHFERKENRSIIIVVLDSEPENRRKIIKLLVEATNKMDKDEELGVMFAQVGEDVITRGFLTALDDDLHRAGAKFDIVDTKMLGEMESSEIHQFLLNALLD